MGSSAGPRHPHSGPGRHGDRVRIAFVIDTLQTGGAERHLLRLVEGLAASGAWDPRVYCLSRSGGFLPAMLSLGVPVDGIPDPWSRSPLRAARSAWHLIRWLRRERPAVVHCYLTQSVLLGSVAARAAGVPHVVTTRRLVQPYAGGKLVAYRAAMAVSDRLSDAVVAVSRAAADQAIREGTPAGRVYVVRNAVVALPETTQPADAGGSVRIGTMGRLQAQKGHRYLIGAAQLVLKQIPGATFAVAGDGPDRAALEAQVRTRGLERQFEFLGNVADVPGFLATLDMFVLPSLYEGLPNALLEAMAAGVPAVASDTEGVREIITSPDVGLLVPTGDPVSLAAAMVRLGSDQHLRAQLSASARRVVETDFAPERELCEMIGVYERVLSNSLTPPVGS